MDLQMRINGSGESNESGDEIRSAVRRRANTKTPARVSEIADDPRVTDIQEAARACEPAGEKRRNWMYGKTVIPIGYVAFLDDLKYGMVSPDRIMRLGDSMRDAAYGTVQDYRLPDDIVETLAEEALVDGQSVATACRLLENPNCLTALRAAALQFGRERDFADRARMVVMQRIRRIEARVQ